MKKSGNKETILICEDEALIAEDLKSRLENLGYNVHPPVFRGEQALRSMETQQPDLVLMDIVLPGKLDGIDAAEIIRDRWGVPVVFLTAYADADRLERAKLTYPFGYLLKPFNERDLKITVEMALYVSRVDAERKKTEAALKESERQKSLILDSTKEMFAYYNLDLEILWCNRESGESVGKSTDELIGKRCHQVWHNSDHPCEVCPVQRAGQTGRPQKDEITTPDGRVWSLRGYPVFGENGSISGLIEFGRDITDRKRAEKKLRESEERYRVLVENAKEAIFVARDQVLVFANPEARKLLGCTESELAEKAVSDFIHPEDLGVFSERCGNSLKEDSPSQAHDFRMLTKSGETRWVEIKAAALSWEGAPAALFLMNDITERKQYQEQLIKSEAQFRAVFETAKDSMFIKDPDLKYVKVNPAMARLFGRPEKDLIGKTDMDLFGEEAGRKVMLEDRKSLAGIILEEFPQKPIHGVMHCFHTIKVPLLDSQGNAVGLCGIARDITQQKEAEDELKDANELLENMSNTENVGMALSRLETGEYLHCNPGFSKITGYEYDEIVGRTPMELGFYTAEERKRLFGGINSSRSFKNMELEFKTRNGSLKTILFSVSVINFREEECLAATMVDITDQKESKAQLERNEKRYRSLVENLPDIFLRFDREHHHLFVSSSVSKLVDINPREFIGKNHRELGFPEELCNFWETNIDRVFHTKKSVNEGFEVAAGSGKIFIDWRLVPEFDSEGRVESVLCIGRDVTDQKTYQEKLKESEANLKALINNTDDIMVSRDIQNKVIAYNSAFSSIVEKLFGFKAYIGLNTVDLLPEKPKEEWTASLERVKAGNNIKQNFSWGFEEGSIKEYELSFNPIYKDGKIVGTAEYTRDITEIVEKEKKLGGSIKERELLLKELHHRVKNNMQVIISLMNLQAQKMPLRYFKWVT